MGEAVKRKEGESLGAFALRAYSAAVNAGSLDPWEDAARAVWVDGHEDGKKLGEREPYP